MPTREERLAGGLLGLLVGDALRWLDRGTRALQRLADARVAAGALASRNQRRSGGRCAGAVAGHAWTPAGATLLRALLSLGAAHPG